MDIDNALLVGVDELRGENSQITGENHKIRALGLDQLTNLLLGLRLVCAFDGTWK